MSDSNRRRALAEVLTVDAWHKAFTEGRTCADLHVDVVFSSGRIGGGDSTGVRFRLALKRAELVVIAPELEPVKINPASIRRDAPREVLGKIETKAKHGKSLNASLRAQAGVSAKGPKADVHAGASASLTKSRQRTVTASQTFKGMQVTQSRTSDDDPRWTIEPAMGEAHLSGRPWNAERSRQLELIDQRPPRSNSMAPAVRIEVRCLREDLEITDIMLEDPSLWTRIRRRKAVENRRIAAEAVIRTLLADEGLIAGDLADPFAQITLAMTTADAV